MSGASIPSIRTIGDIASERFLMPLRRFAGLGLPCGLLAAGSLAVALATAAPAGAFVAGFGANTPARVAKAAALGVNTDILYEGPPSPASRLGRALQAAHMTVIDARPSTELFFWECHRTHTVAPPPEGRRNSYCAKDDEPSVDSPAVVLASVGEELREDAANPLVSGYWVLDDWAPWDGGSGRELLEEVHGEIEAATPGYPAICGFGGSIEKEGEAGGFAAGIARNYSAGGCSVVGLYDYTGSARSRSSGAGYEWDIRLLLGEQEQALGEAGWSEALSPLFGIGQAWSGKFAAREYQPGLSAAQMLDEADAFCEAGASSLGWYAWSDSGFRAGTKTPLNSPAIREGIGQSLTACPAVTGGL